MDKNRIYIATFSEHAVETAAKYGVNLELNDTCISMRLDPEHMDVTLRSMEKELTKAGSRNAIVHGPFTEIIPSAIDHRAVEFGMERLQEAYKATAEMGLNRMVVHTGFIPLMYHKNWHLERSLEFWKRFMEDKPADFRLYIENVFDDEPNMMADLIDDLDDFRVRICLDVGHAHAMTVPEYDVYQWIEILGERIGHFHMHNNDGTADTHQSMTDGTLDMARIMKIIKDHCTDDVTFTIESRKSEENVVWLLEQ